MSNAQGEGGACCACLRVIYKPVEHGGGLMSERWVCADSDAHEFVRRGMYDVALSRGEQRAATIQRELDEARAALVLCVEVLETHGHCETYNYGAGSRCGECGSVREHLDSCEYANTLAAARAAAAGKGRT